MRAKAVIFDLDGTLIHTLPDIHTSINLMLAELSLPAREYENTLAGLNRGAKYLVKNALPEEKRDDEELLSRALSVYDGIYAQHYGDTTAPFEGIEDMTASLSAAGVKLAVMSNKPHKFTVALTSRLFPGIFSEVAGQGEFPVKPSPEAPLAIAKRLGFEPGEMFFVGDSDVDMETAKNAGMTPVAVTWGYRDAELLVRAGAKLVMDTPAALAEFLLGGIG